MMGTPSTGPAGTFTQYSTTKLYCYPDVTSPQLFYWCTAETLPSEPFSIAQAWGGGAYAGWFLFVSDPAVNLANPKAVSQAMGNLAEPPAQNSGGFLWLYVDGGSDLTLPVSGDVLAAGAVFGTSSGLHQLELKKGAPIILQGDGTSFAILYPEGLPQADPPEKKAAFPIVLDLLGLNAGRFSFTGFQPYGDIYYQYDLVVDPLDPAGSSSTFARYAIQLVPTGEAFPAYAIRPLS